LFLIYVNDIQSAVSSATVKLLADDTILFFHCKHPEELYTIADTSMVQLSESITVNKLHLNVDKTCYSIFGLPGLTAFSDIGQETEWVAHTWAQEAQTCGSPLLLQRP